MHKIYSQDFTINTSETGFQAGLEQSIETLRQQMNGCEAFLLVAIAKMPDDKIGVSAMSGGAVSPELCLHLREQAKKLNEKVAFQALQNIIKKNIFGGCDCPSCRAKREMTKPH